MNMLQGKAVPIGGIGPVFALLLVMSPELATAQPAVHWQPTSLAVAVKPGETLRIPLVLTATKATSATEFRVVPTLQTFVAVEPATLGPMVAGQFAAVTLVASAPNDALPTTLDGTIQLRELDKPGKPATDARPLPVTLSVVWHKAPADQNGISFSYSAFGQQASLTTDADPSGVYYNVVELRDAATGEMVPQYAVNYTANPERLTLLQWFSSNVDTGGHIISAGQYAVKVLQNGMQVIELTGSIPSAHLDANGPVPDLFASPADRSQIIVIQTLQGNFLGELGIADPKRWQAYEAILGSFSFE